MAIHHNTTKRATSLGLKIVESRDGLITVEGEIILGAESSFHFPAGTKAADALQAAYQARVYAKAYHFEIRQTANGDFHTQMPGGQSVKGADLLEVLTRAVDTVESRRKKEQALKIVADKANDEDGEESDEEAEEIAQDGAEESEIEPSGSVVREKYRELYAQKGHPDNCGDDLAAQLAAMLKSSDGLEIDRLWALAQLNGIEYTKYLTGNRGWEGRARMSIGNVLRGRIRRGEEVVLEIH